MRRSTLLFAVLALVLMVVGVVANDCAYNCQQAENKCLAACTTTQCDGQCAQALIQCKAACVQCSADCSKVYNGCTSGCKDACGGDQACLTRCNGRCWTQQSTCDTNCGRI